MKGNTSIGTISDIDGNFTLAVPNDNVTLVVSFIGMKSQEVIATAQKPIKVILEDDSQQLEEVVVVGFGQQKKASVIGAIAQTNSKTLERTGGVTSLGQALTGNLPGVVTMTDTGKPGDEDPKITIRGVTSWNSSDPLVLVDGVERPMSSVDISSVASISVLKDASATAIYGSRAIEGAIIIALLTKEEYQAKQYEKTLGDKIDALQNKLNSNDVKKVSYFLDDKEVSDTELQTLRQNKASEYDVVTVETDGKPAVKIKTKPVSNITIRGLKGTVKSVNGTPVFPDTSYNENRVAGKVCDTDGNPVIGACVLVEGTTIGTVTDLNGTFKLETLKGSVLSVSYIDMQTAKVKVEDAGPLNKT